MAISHREVPFTCLLDRNIFREKKTTAFLNSLQFVGCYVRATRGNVRHETSDQTGREKSRTRKPEIEKLQAERKCTVSNT